MNFFQGIVEDRNDPLEANRVRVRIFGLHSINRGELPTSDLPWALVGVPTTAASMNGIGNSPHGLVEGTLVYGTFLDGHECQHPLIMGSIIGIPDAKPSPTFGFSDPSGTYPKESHINEPDVNRLSRGVSAGETSLAGKVANKRNNVFSGLLNSWNEPSSQYNAEYPFNKVIETESGHVIEVDDTPGSERIQVFHRSGSFVEFFPDGTVVKKSTKHEYSLTSGDSFVNIDGSASVTVDQNAIVLIKGSAEIIVEGNLNAKVTGNTCLLTSGDMAHEVGGELNIKCDKYKLEAREFDFGETVINPNLLCPALKLTAFDYAAQDDEPETDAGIPPEELEVLLERSDATLPVEGEVDPAPAQVDEGVPPSCQDIPEDFDSSLSLGGGWTIADLSTRAVFPHSIRAQAGLTRKEIACNLKGVVENILIPLGSYLGGRNKIQINSGFRPGSGRSQHERGQAVDVHLPGAPPERVLEVAKWIRDNLPVDQIINEKANTGWIHVSYNTGSAKQRGSVLTRTRPGVYKPGLILLS